MADFQIPEVGAELALVNEGSYNFYAERSSKNKYVLIRTFL
jgi:hypothetical protein